jgi:hypothetical protein
MDIHQPVVATARILELCDTALQDTQLMLAGIRHVAEVGVALD